MHCFNLQDYYYYSTFNPWPNISWIIIALVLNIRRVKVLSEVKAKIFLWNLVGISKRWFVWSTDSHSKMNSNSMTLCSSFLKIIQPNNTFGFSWLNPEVFWLHYQTELNSTKQKNVCPINTVIIWRWDENEKKLWPHLWIGPKSTICCWSAAQFRLSMQSRDNSLHPGNPKGLIGL